MRFFLSVGILFQGCDSDVKCRNDNGDEVDWLVDILSSGSFIFSLTLSVTRIHNTMYLSTYIIRYILYKLPKVTGKGLSYLYMDESTNGWKLSKKKIDSTSGTVANTLKPLLDFYDRKVTYSKYRCVSLLHSTVFNPGH